MNIKWIILTLLAASVLSAIMIYSSWLLWNDAYLCTGNMKQPISKALTYDEMCIDKKDPIIDKLKLLEIQQGYQFQMPDADDDSGLGISQETIVAILGRPDFSLGINGSSSYTYQRYFIKITFYNGKLVSIRFIK